MIVFDLMCSRQHRFEGWFRSSDEFARQQSGGLLTCPQCNCSHVSKAPMAPAVPAKMNRAAPQAIGEGDDTRAKDKSATPDAVLPALVAAMTRLAEAQAKALERSTWVGDDFAERTRAIHYGEREEEQIHGRASPGEARALIEEGIAIAPLLVPIVPPEEAN